jgi:hypothetical protein
MENARKFGNGYFIPSSRSGSRKAAAQPFIEWAVEVARD